jgi:sugar phosphate isomerase/epimerase
MSRLKVAAQLIIWGDETRTNLRGVLEEVRGAGYEGIEASPEVVVGNPTMVRELLRKNNLKLVALHMGVGDLEKSEQALKVLGDYGGEYLTFSGPGGRGTDADYQNCAKFLNEIGRRSKEYGVRICYHNHGHEISENQRGIRMILEATDPEVVGLCVDTYWVKFGGSDPLRFLEENRSRVGYLHLKDGSEEDMKNRRFCELGKGSIDFPAVLRFAVEEGLSWVVVEQDWTSGSPYSSMAESRDYLRRLGY